MSHLELPPALRQITTNQPELSLRLVLYQYNPGDRRVGAALAAAHPDMHVGDRDDRKGRPYD